MPTYQYSCTDCGHFFEIVQSFSDDSLTVCPECEGRLRKVFNAVGVVFKGSGFYRNDSRAGSPAPRPAAKTLVLGNGSSDSSGSGSVGVEERVPRAPASSKSLGRAPPAARRSATPPDPPAGSSRPCGLPARTERGSAYLRAP